MTKHNILAGSCTDATSTLTGDDIDVQITDLVEQKLITKHVEHYTTPHQSIYDGLIKNQPELIQPAEYVITDDGILFIKKFLDVMKKEFKKEGKIYDKIITNTMLRHLVITSDIFGIIELGIKNISLIWFIFESIKFLITG